MFSLGIHSFSTSLFPTPVLRIDTCFKRELFPKRLTTCLIKTLAHPPEDYTTTLEADNSSGKINLSDITASSLRAENTSGGIDIDNVNSSAISAKTSSGGLRIENTSCDTINGKSTSGNIKIEALDAATEIVLQASSGGIHGSIVGKAEDFSIITNTTSGSSNLQNGNGGSKQLNCETTSGNIKIDFVN